MNDIWILGRHSYKCRMGILIEMKRMLATIGMLRFILDFNITLLFKGRS